MKNFAKFFTLLTALAFAMGTTACTKSKGQSADSPPSMTTDDGTASTKTDPVGNYEPDSGDDSATTQEPATKVKCPAGCVPKGVNCPKGCVKAKTKRVKRQRRYRQHRRYRRPATMHRTPTTVASGDLNAVDREQNRRLDAVEDKNKAQDKRLDGHDSDLAAIKAARAKEDDWREGVDKILEGGNR